MTLPNLVVFGGSLLFLAVAGVEIVRATLKRRPAFGVGLWLGMAFTLLLAAAAIQQSFKSTAASVLSAGAANAYMLFYALMLLWLLRRRSFPAVASTDPLVLRGSVVGSSAEVMSTLYGVGARKVGALGGVIRIGEVVIPVALEAQHFLFSGTTGSGKTQAINPILQVVRSRGSRALVADAGGGFVSRFLAPGDLIFNPFDRRSVDWSPFAEVRAEYDCARIAKAAIPDGHGDGQEWHHYAQTLLGETMLALVKQGLPSVRKLLYYLTIAESRELGELLHGTPAGILCASGNDKMLANTRGIISTYLVAWRYLADDGQFSVREWVKNSARSNWLFITFRDDQIGMLRALVATLLEVAVIEALSLAEDEERDCWLVMDEVDSLGKVSSLRAGLTKLRKYGWKVILGLQTVSQLRATYGRDEAQTLLANLSTKLVLRAGDGETAEYFSREFGDQETTRMQWSESQGSSRSLGLSGQASESSSSSTTQVQETKRTVLASEIGALPDLEGFLRTPGAPIGYVHLPYAKLPAVADAFVAGEAGVLRSAPPAATLP